MESDQSTPPERSGTGGRTCEGDKHQFEFFDSFPGYEIYECRICKLRKFVNQATGAATYDMPAD